MKIKQLLLAVATATLSLSAKTIDPTKTVEQVRIYINPGHGAFTTNDRPMATMKHGAAGADTAGFYESNTNLWKSFGMLEKLKEYGIPYNTSIPATSGSQTNIRFSRVKNGGTTDGVYDRELSTVHQEAETWGADIIISIHSNANTGGDSYSAHTNFNQLLFLFRGYDKDPYHEGSNVVATACWKHAIKNKHMHWNWLADPTKPYNSRPDEVDAADWPFTGRNYYPEDKDADGNPYWIKGDWDFRSDWGTQGFRVLRGNVPGFLVEGYDHTYSPARHRAMNQDVCRHEGEMYARGLNDYFGWNKKDTYGKIYGIIRDQSVTMNYDAYKVISNPTIDANSGIIDQVDNKKPLNNVKVTLYDSNGAEKQSYTTDDEWNGAYMFKNVAPGTYTIKHSLPGYNEVTKIVTVVANETNYVDIDMREAGSGEPIRGNYAYDLKLTQTDDKTYTASFKSTGAMSNGKIILTNTSNKEQVVIIETGAIKAGENSVKINATTLGDGVTYSWAVAFDNPQSTGYGLIYSDNSIVYGDNNANARIGLAIDKDQTSPRFGTFYTVTGKGQGIQRFNPDFSRNGSKTTTGYFGLDDPSSTNYYKYMRTSRMTVNGGKVYVATYAGTNKGVWVHNPEQPSAGATNILNYWYEKAVGFSGTEENRVMYVYHDSSLKLYNVGKSDSWPGNANNPSKDFEVSLMANGDGDLIVTDKGIFISQNRYVGKNLSNEPAFVFMDKSNGTILFNSSSLSSTLTSSHCGGMAITRDLSTFAIVDGQTELQSDPIILKNNDINVQVYKVTWNGNTPSFTPQYSIPLSGTTTVDQMEFDHADNLYIASQQQGLLVYAIKNPSRQTVTNGSGTIVGVKPPTPLYIVGNSDAIGNWDPAKAIEFTNNGNNYTITLNETVTEFKISTGKGDETTFNNGNLAVSGAITNGGTLNLIADKDGGNIALPWEGVWNITIAGDLSTLTATTFTPNPEEGPGIGPEPENAPNPDALPGEETEDAQPEGYFAYDLETPVKNGNVYTFNFKSTGARKNGYIVLKNKTTGATTKIKTPIAKGQNTITINAYDIQNGNYNTWAVEIYNRENSTPKEVGSNNLMIGTGSRIGIAIDNDQTSANFGTIYTHTVGSNGGIQKINPDMTTNGGKVFANQFGLGNQLTSARIATSGGKVYVANYSNTNPGLWVCDPNTAKKTAINTSYWWRAVAFSGTGNNRIMYVTTTTTTNKNLVQAYIVGNSDTWSSTPAETFNSSYLVNDGNVIATEKGIFVSQHRYKGANTATNPAFVFYGSENINYSSKTLDLFTRYTGDKLSSKLTGHQIGGMAISPDNKTFAIVDSYTEGSPSNINVHVYSVSWNGNTPSFTHQYEFKLEGTQQVDQMEFDHAGNLCVGSVQKGLLKYAMKRSAGSVTTNARAEFTINGLGRGVAPTNVVATRKCYGEGNNTTAGIVDAEITWKGDAGDYKVFYQTMRRDASGNRVYDNNGAWVEAGTATIASGSTIGTFTHKNLAAGSDYNRIYNYKVANYYPAANYPSDRYFMEISGKGRTVTSSTPSVPVKVTISQPTEEKNGRTLYTFDLKLDIELDKDVFNATLLDDNDEPVKATKYVIVVDETTAKTLNKATNVKEAGYFYRGSATMTANNCNHHVINDWYMVVDFDDVTPSGDLTKATKSITWKNVYPGITYKPQVYTSAVRTFNFTAADAINPEEPDAQEFAMTLPVPKWLWEGAEDAEGRAIIGLSELSGDYSPLVGIEDYPMGTFRKVGDTENATNPVAITKANVIGTTGVMIEPLALTDEVLGYNPETGKYDVNVWRLSYSFDLYKINPETGQWEIVTYASTNHQGVYSELFSNTQKRFVDIVNFDIECKEEIGPDGRIRYVYDSEKAPIYKVASIVNYDYLPNGDGTDLRSFYEKEIIVKPNFPAPQIVSDNSSAKYVFLEKSTHWDENCDINGGYYKYYYDAAMDLKWNEFDDNLVRNIGFHATPQFNCVGHNVKNEDGTVSDKWVPYYAASVLTDNEVVHYNARATNNYKEEKNIFTNIGYTGTEDWTALANQKRHLPVKVHYVWAGNELIPTVKDAAFEFELTADYPIYVDRHYGKPAFFVNSYTGEPYNLAPVQTMARSSEKVEEVFVVSAPTKLNMTMDDIVTVEDVTTGVEDVAFSKGVLMVYPNPAQSEVTIRSTTALGDVKIFTIDGQLVKEFESGETKAKLNVSDLTSGVYVVSASGTTTRMIKK